MILLQIKSALGSLIIISGLALSAACDRTADAEPNRTLARNTSLTLTDSAPARDPAAEKGFIVRALDASSRELEVPFVATPMVIVDKILELGNVDADDVLYDLGSGDGRIVIRAAKKFGTRGIGYDLDPARIQESNENARKAGVTDRVQFIQQDIFTVDLSGASVVTMYLLPEVNLRLKPKLLRELKRGARIVSHNYGMGDWEPEHVAEFNIAGETHYATVWEMPPSLAKERQAGQP